MRYILVGLLTLILTVTVIGKDSCSAFVTDALATLDNICEATGRNELCYGNKLVSVSTFTGDEIDFLQPGDTTSILDIASIRTSSYAEPDEWGIALMKAQANIPDSLPGQHVTFLLYGDVNLTNAGSTPNTTILIGNTTSNVNVRSDPSTSHMIAGSLQSNTQTELIGRNVIGDWVFFKTEETSGWLFTSLLQIEGDVMTLNEVPDDFVVAPSIAPMQAIYFSSGIGEVTCNEVPRDGILIQTPEYEQSIELVVNDVEIRLGSTAYLQAQAGGVMTIYVVEGFATVTAKGKTVAVPEGASTAVTIDEELHAIGDPSEPEAYSEEDLEPLPLEALPRDIELASSASQLRISQANTCSAVTSNDISIRSGPGTNYRLVAGLPPAQTIIANGQARDNDNYLWWRLNANTWVRSDFLDEQTAACDNLAFVDPSEPMPEPEPPRVSGSNRYRLSDCSSSVGPIREGQRVAVIFVIGGWLTLEEGQAALQAHSLIIMADNIPLELEIGDFIQNPSGRYIKPAAGYWIATRGTHVISGRWSYGPSVSVCILTVER